MAALRSSYYGFAAISPAQKVKLKTIKSSDEVDGEVLFYAGLVRSVGERMDYFKHALAKGYAPAKAGIANEILSSADTSEEKRLFAMGLLEESIEEGDPAASGLLGVVLADGVLGVKRDPERARSLLDQALKKGFLKYAYRLVALNKELGDEERAAAALKDAALAGDVRAMTDFGIAQILNSSNAQDRSVGFSMLEEAAEAGYPPAMAALGQAIADKDNKSELDQSHALTLVRKAAVLREPNAEVFLAGIYLDGLLGQNPDPVAGIAILEKASRAGNSRAKVQLAKILLSGSYGQQVDRERAEELVHQAALAGDQDAVKLRSEIH